MIIKKTIILIGLLTLFVSCEKDKKNSYTNKNIGWTIDIPKNWNVISKRNSEITKKKALDLINKEIEQKIDASGLITLLSFQKNQINAFQSGLKTLDPVYQKLWKEYNIGLKEQVYKLYKSQGYKINVSEMTTIKIDGINFYTYEFKIRNDNVNFNQLIYSGLINNIVLAVNINYNNESDKKEMLDSWLNSKFEK